MAGTGWAMIAVLIGQGASLVTQFVAGHKLDEEQFRVWGLAMAIAGIALAIRTAGVRDVLVQSGDEFPDLARPVLHIGLAIAIAAAGLLGLAAPMLERAFDADGLTVMLWVLVFSVPLGVPGRIYNARLSIDLRFRAIQTIIVTNNIFRQSTAIVLLLLGFGPVSMVLPMISCAIFEWVVSRWAAGGIPPATRQPTRETYKYVFTASKWIVVAIIGTVLVDNLDKVAIDLVVVGPVLGVYFFAYRLTMGFFALFRNSMANVMMPSLARLTALGLERQRYAYERSARTLVFLCGPMCVAMCLAAEPAIHLLWNGRWDEAIIPTQLMALSLVTRMLATLGTALNAARGAWRRNGLILVIDGIGTGLAGLLGAWMGGLVTLTLVISVYRFLSGLVIYALAGNLIHVSWRHLLVEVTLPATLSICFVGLSQFVALRAGAAHPVLISMPVFAGLTLGYALLFQRGVVREMLAVLLNRTGRAGPGREQV